jgi:hypothetical protein
MARGSGIVSTLALSALNAAFFTLGPDLGAGALNTLITLVFGAGTTAGTVVIEGSHDPNYAGAWANLATVAWTAASTVKQVTVAGPFQYLRARISVAVVGGTIDAFIQVTQ